MLSWGRRYLMCPPAHFGVLYEINPWMHQEVAADPDRSMEQWQHLVSTLRQAGSHVELLDSVAGLPDMVFTANAGVVDDDKFIVSRFRHPERGGEEPHYASWFAGQGSKVLEVPLGMRFEGAGDALPFGDALLAGYRIRSDIESHLAISELLGIPVLSVELVDPRFYHLDLGFCPLSSTAALIAPDAFDHYGTEVIRSLVPDPIVLSLDESLSFCANSVVIGATIVMPSCPPRIGRELEKRQFDIIVCPVDEFLKAGGGCRCLTLALDVSFAHTGE